jgi:hypothetical protein
MVHGGSDAVATVVFCSPLQYLIVVVLQASNPPCPNKSSHQQLTCTHESDACRLLQRIGSHPIPACPRLPNSHYQPAGRPLLPHIYITSHHLDRRRRSSLATLPLMIDPRGRSRTCFARARQYSIPPLLWLSASGSRTHVHTHNKQLELNSVADATLARRRRSVRTCLPNEDPSPKADCTSLLAIDRRRSIRRWRRKVIACK